MNDLVMNLLLIISSVLGMYLYMSWTTQQSWRPIINSLYDIDKCLQGNQEFQIMATTSYYLVIIFIASYLSLEILKFLKATTNPTQDNENNILIKSFNDVYLNSFYEFIIFICLYFYFIKHHNNITTQLQSILIPLWFLSARIFYFIGYILTSIAGINLKYYGTTLTLFTYIIILGQSFGYSSFQIL